MKYKKAAFSFSLILLLLWGCLGAGTSLAWFIDEDNDVKNVFHFAEFDLEVSHLVNGDWQKIEEGTKIFDESALYEPGYVQVVYLKVENKGTVPFEFKTAVSATNLTEATNYYGQKFFLQDYLRFGLTEAKTEEAVFAAVDTREKAIALANTRLANYSETGIDELEAGGTRYIALVVSMPDYVDNSANYKTGSDVPQVQLGVIVSATQVIE